MKAFFITLLIVVAVVVGITYESKPKPVVQQDTQELQKLKRQVRILNAEKEYWMDQYRQHLLKH